MHVKIHFVAGLWYAAPSRALPTIASYNAMEVVVYYRMYQAKIAPRCTRFDFEIPTGGQISGFIPCNKCKQQIIFLLSTPLLQ